VRALLPCGGTQVWPACMAPNEAHSRISSLPFAFTCSSWSSRSRASSTLSCPQACSTSCLQVVSAVQQVEAPHGSAARAGLEFKPEGVAAAAAAKPAQAQEAVAGSVGSTAQQDVVAVGRQDEQVCRQRRLPARLAEPLPVAACATSRTHPSCTLTHTHTHTHAPAHTPAHTQTPAHTRTHAHTHTRTCAHAHKHKHTRTLTYTHAHTHAHTHTRTRMPSTDVRPGGRPGACRCGPEGRPCPTALRPQGAHGPGRGCGGQGAHARPILLCSVRCGRLWRPPVCTAQGQRVSVRRHSARLVCLQGRGRRCSVRQEKEGGGSP